MVGAATFWNNYQVLKYLVRNLDHDALEFETSELLSQTGDNKHEYTGCTPVMLAAMVKENQ